MRREALKMDRKIVDTMTPGVCLPPPVYARFRTAAVIIIAPDHCWDGDCARPRGRLIIKELRRTLRIFVRRVYKFASINVSSEEEEFS